MSFFNPIHKLKIGVVEKTMDEEGTSSSQDEKLRFSSVEVL